MQNSLYARTAWVWPGEIDALNILNATRRAMEEAARGLPGAIFLVDAVTGLDLPGAIESIVHGDAQCYSIAAASIVAKVERDRYMVQLDARYRSMALLKTRAMAPRSIWRPCANAAPALNTEKASFDF